MTKKGQKVIRKKAKKIEEKKTQLNAKQISFVPVRPPPPLTETLNTEICTDIINPGDSGLRWPRDGCDDLTSEVQTQRLCV